MTNDEARSAKPNTYSYAEHEATIEAAAYPLRWRQVARLRTYAKTERLRRDLSENFRELRNDLRVAPSLDGGPREWFVEAYLRDTDGIWGALRMFVQGWIYGAKGLDG